MVGRIVIVGAVALGPKVACRIRRLNPEAEIILIDRDDVISYGGCGIPYYIGGDISDIEDLYRTSSHALRDTGFFKNSKGIEVRTRLEAIWIDRREKRVQVKELDGGREYFISYDKLVLATGGAPVRPPFPGADLDRVFTIANLHDAMALKELMTRGEVGRAVVVGAGAIGLEITEALTDLWGIHTTLVEMEDQVLPTLLGKCIARITGRELEHKGVRVMLSERVLSIEQEDGGNGLLVNTTSESLQADIVVLAAGVRPNTDLAREAQLSVGMSGGIIVDHRMRTSDPDIYAGGDCVEVRHLVSGENVVMALGSLANRQGRVIANNLCGYQSHFRGTVGTFCLKAFEIGVARAGLTYRQAKESGFDPVYAVVSQADHAHFYPSAELLYITLLADRKTRKILGIEAAGRRGEAVKDRVDTVAALLAHGVDVDEICTLESGYAPPYASAMDVLNNAGNALDNILAGKNHPIDAADFLNEFSRGEIPVLDVRGQSEAGPFREKYGELWINIPQDQLRARLGEIPKDKEIFLLCDTGPRSYEAQVLLSANGIEKTRNIQGGFAMIRATDPEFI